MVLTEAVTLGVDTAAERKDVERMMLSDPTMGKYIS